MQDSSFSVITIIINVQMTYKKFGFNQIINIEVILEII